MDTIETYMLVDGEYRMVRVTADQILNRNGHEKQKKKAPPPKPPEEPAIGLLSTTLVHSPVINKILPARIRGTEFNDLLFVGENFVHIVEIQQDGHLRHIGTKSDFGSRIRAAAVIGRRVEEQDEPYLPFIKREKLNSVTDNESSEPQTVSPQMLVVSLESGELRAFFAEYDHTTTNLRFFESSTTLPLATSAIQQPGKHLAVDPRARAIAVASMNGTLIIYKLKCRERIEEEFHSDSHSWQPIGEDFPIPVDGIILQMEFLTPAPDDNDHATLVVIVNTEPQVCRIICYNFDITTSFRLHPGTETVINLQLEHGRSQPSFQIWISSANVCRIHADKLYHPYVILSEFPHREWPQNSPLAEYLHRNAHRSRRLLSRPSRPTEEPRKLNTASRLYSLDKRRKTSSEMERRKERSILPRPGRWYATSAHKRGRVNLCTVSCWYFRLQCLHGFHEFPRERQVQGPRLLDRCRSQQQRSGTPNRHWGCSTRPTGQEAI